MKRETILSRIRGLDGQVYVFYEGGERRVEQSGEEGGYGECALCGAEAWLEAGGSICWDCIRHAAAEEW